MISRSWFRVQRIYAFLNEAGSHARKFHWYDKNVIKIVLICSFLYISLSTPLMLNCAHTYQQQGSFYLMRQFCFISFRIYKCQVVVGVNNKLILFRGYRLIWESICFHCAISILLGCCVDSICPSIILSEIF